MEEKNTKSNFDDKLYNLLHEALEQQRDIIKSNTEAVYKYSSSMDETMLILDNRFEQDSKEKMETMKHMATENRKTVLWTAGIISIAFTILAISYLLIYFFSPSDVTATSVATATSNAVSSSTNNAESSAKQLKEVESIGGETNANGQWNK